ncbi:ankyrin repeat domain-containing protein 7-like isoform X1 [Periplaneta americana]|uniref:ankyrin repeat domain-containing protein 7-like isoform X1 n=1 Tax=Periplaneta americana TaxID=6978 RepID=UPI0037E7B2CD
MVMADGQSEMVRTLSERVSSAEDGTEANCTDVSEIPPTEGIISNHDPQTMATPTANLFNCSEVQLGHRLHYHAPVVINQNFLSDKDQDTAKKTIDEIIPNDKVKVRYNVQRGLLFAWIRRRHVLLVVVAVFIANIAVSTTISLVITHNNREKRINQEPANASWKKLKRYLDMLEKHRNISADWTSAASVARYGTSQLLDALLDCGADPDVLDDRGFAALHIAAQHDDQSKALVLIKHRANLTIRSREEGDSPLMRAAAYNRLRLATLLLENGVPGDCRNKILDTPLHFAAMNDNDELVNRLILYGADVNARNNRNETALFIAIGLGAVKAIDLLIAKGADVNLANDKLETPLHYAAVEDNVNLTRLLVQKGADIHARNYLHKTPLEVAKPGVKKWLSAYLECDGTEECGI